MDNNEELTEELESSVTAGFAIRFLWNYLKWDRSWHGIPARTFDPKDAVRIAAAAEEGHRVASFVDWAMCKLSVSYREWIRTMPDQQLQTFIDGVQSFVEAVAEASITLQDYLHALPNANEASEFEQLKIARLEAFDRHVKRMDDLMDKHRKQIAHIATVTGLDEQEVFGIAVSWADADVTNLGYVLGSLMDRANLGLPVERAR